MKSFHLLFFFLLLFTTSATSTLIAGNKLTISINETHLNTRVFCCPPFATQVLALMNMANRKGQHRDDPFFFLFLYYFSRLVPLTFAYFVVEIKRVNLSLKIMFEIGHRDTRDCSRGKEVRKIKKKKNNIRNTGSCWFSTVSNRVRISRILIANRSIWLMAVASRRMRGMSMPTDVLIYRCLISKLTEKAKKNEWQLPQVEQHLAFA